MNREATMRLMYCAEEDRRFTCQLRRRHLDRTRSSDFGSKSNTLRAQKATDHKAALSSAKSPRRLSIHTSRSIVRSQPRIRTTKRIANIICVRTEDLLTIYMTRVH